MGARSCWVNAGERFVVLGVVWLQHRRQSSVSGSSAVSARTPQLVGQGEIDRARGQRRGSAHHVVGHDETRTHPGQRRGHARHVVLYTVKSIASDGGCWDRFRTCVSRTAQCAFGPVLSAQMRRRPGAVRGRRALQGVRIIAHWLRRSTGNPHCEACMCGSLRTRKAAARGSFVARST